MRGRCLLPSLAHGCGCACTRHMRSAQALCFGCNRGAPSATPSQIGCGPGGAAATTLVWQEKCVLSGQEGGRAAVNRRVPAEIWPQDRKARAGIAVERRLRCGCTSAAYLAELRSALAELDASGFHPHLVIHNAGTDVLDGDPLGRCVPC